MLNNNNNRNNKGTGFTNINRILQANQGNKLGSTVSSSVQNQANQVRSSVQQSQQNFQQEADKNRLDTQEAKDKRDNIIGRFGDNSNTSQTSGAGNQQQPLQGTQQVANQVAQNVPQPIVSDDEIKDFTKFRTGTYTGPNQLQDFQTILGKASGAEQVGDLTRSTGGRQELLRRYVGGNDYTQGQQRLDTMLLGQQNQGELNEARKATRGLENVALDANTQAGNLATEYGNRAKIFGQETVDKLTGARDPISQTVDQRLAQIQAHEQERQGFMKSIQDTLLGQGEFSGLDKVTRLGLGLQDAMDAGYITQAQANKLLGEGGLISRAENLGLDTNKLLTERLKDIAAQNMNRGGAATADQEMKLNALDRLMGKQGLDAEFNNAGADYIAGKGEFNLDSLNDYITKSEREKYANDAAKLAELEAYNQRYLNQAIANGQIAMQGAQDLTSTDNMDATKVAGLGTLAAGAGFGMAGAQAAGTMGAYGAGGAGAAQIGAGASGGASAAAGPALIAMIAADMATGNDSTARTANTAGTTAIAGQNAAFQGSNAILEGLTKLNIGGKSIANTPAGEQLLKAIAYKSKLENELTGEQKKALDETTGEYGNMTKSAIHDPFNSTMQNFYATGGLSIFKPTAKRVGEQLIKEISSSRATKEIGKGASNVAKSVGNAVKKITSGKGIKISDEELKTGIDYDPEEVNKFIDKLHPVSYNYKDEVKDSPMASDERELGVMAQDLEKSKLGKEAVIETDVGKVVDYEDLQPKILATLASMNKKIQELEKKDKKKDK